jgi:hypothetical protein
MNRNVRLTVILRDSRKFSKVVRAPAGKQFTATGIDSLLNNEANLIEKFFPDREFRLVPLAKGFNFVEIAKAAEAS